MNAQGEFMKYEHTFIPPDAVPQAKHVLFQHIVETYASEINKTASVWMQFSDADLEWKPHARSASVRDIMQHQLLSERRFFGEFLGTDEPDVSRILPEQGTVLTLCECFVRLATPRLAWLGALDPQAWTEKRAFFGEQRERIWIFWRRVLHTAHHRTQLTVYLRLLDKTVPAIYGPTADVSWQGADPTTTLEAARRQ
jgi:uncharacterized damage-inducible protein DinB